MDVTTIFEAIYAFAKAHDQENIIIQDLILEMKKLDTRGVPAKIVIEQDESPLNPREDFDSVGTMCCWSSRYNLGDTDGIEMCQDDIRESKKYRDSWEEEFDWNEPRDMLAMAKKCGFIILPLFLYDHSGITISTAPFTCRWDSGQLGFIYATKDKLRKYFGTKKVNTKIAVGTLEGEVKFYDQYLTNDVYRFEVLDALGDQIDSCGGFYGSNIHENGIVEQLPEDWESLEIEKPEYM